MRKLQLFLWWFLLTACTVSSSEAQTTVYITRTGAKYHTGDCRYLRQSKIAIDLKDALDQGYTPCSVCGPATEVESEDNEQGSAGTPTSTAGSRSPVVQKKTMPVRTKSSQCTALTKTGHRCKRAATNNGKCWQHQ